jgi:hypothetical protein
VKNIEALIDDGGNITLGRLPPFDCAATAVDGSNCLAMSERYRMLRPGPHRLCDYLTCRARTLAMFVDANQPKMRATTTQIANTDARPVSLNFDRPGP